MRANALVLVFVAALLGSSAARSETYLQIDSEPGDPVGEGELFFFADESSFSLVREADNGVRVVVRMPEPINGRYYWSIRIFATGDRPLVPGPYEDAHLRVSTSDVLEAPSMRVRGPFATSCRSVEGRFDVLDIAFDEAGDLVRLAADIEQRCDGSTATLGSRPAPRAFAINLLTPISGGAAEATELPSLLRVRVLLSHPYTGRPTKR